jgi:hypothetical protein
MGGNIGRFQLGEKYGKGGDLTEKVEQWKDKGKIEVKMINRFKRCKRCKK